MSGDILGTYDLEKKVEDIVILLENTRNNYGNPDIVVEIEGALVEMVNTKMSIEPKARFALVTFSKVADSELNFDEYSAETFQERLYEIELAPEDEANIDIGLTKAFEVTVQSMQQMAEGKRFRMMIISAGNVIGDKKWKDLINVSEKVGIYVDTIQIAKPFAPRDNILETIAKRTEGFFYYCEDIGMLESILSNLVPAKSEQGLDKSQSREDRDMRGLLEYIAADLTTLDTGIKTVEDLKKLVAQQDETMKCGICHSPDCMFCKGPAFSCGAFCPACGRFYHQHCCAGWAESQSSQTGTKTVFKCPVCFHLLKVPGTLHRIQILKTNLIDNERQPITQNLNKINIKDFGMQGAFKYCSWCRNVFNPNEEIFRCESCESFYHADCVELMLDKTKNRCRVCDAPVGLSARKAAGIERIV